MANLGETIFAFGIIGLAIASVIVMAWFAYESHKWGNRKQ